MNFHAFDLAVIAGVLVAAAIGFTYAIRWDRTCGGCSRRFPNAAERLAHERRAHQF